MKHFVIRYDRSTGGMELKEFGDFAAAMKLRHELESSNSEPSIEIVTISSPSLEMLQRTHRRYFLNEFIGETQAVAAL